MPNHRTFVTRSSQHVLVLDHDLDLLEIVRRRLEREGYAVTTSSTPWGIELAIAQLRPDVVLLDPLMSDSIWQGLPALLANHPADGDVPIVLHSSAPAALRSALNVTAALGLIQKTWDDLSFTFAFNGLLDHRRELNTAPSFDSATARAAGRSGSHAVNVSDGGAEDYTVRIRVRGKP